METRSLKLVLAAAVCALLAAAPAAASAAPRNSAWDCNVNSTCFYPHRDGTGTLAGYLNVDNQDQWIAIPSADRYAMYLDGNSAVEVWNAQSGFHACYPAGSKVDLNNEFGHFYINYGHANLCTGVPRFN